MAVENMFFHFSRFWQYFQSNLLNKHVLTHGVPIMPVVCYAFTQALGCSSITGGLLGCSRSLLTAFQTSAAPGLFVEGGPDGPLSHGIKPARAQGRQPVAGELELLCWCHPLPCHAEVVRAAVLWLADRAGA